MASLTAFDPKSIAAIRINILVSVFVKVSLDFKK